MADNKADFARIGQMFAALMALDLSSPASIPAFMAQYPVRVPIEYGLGLVVDQSAIRNVGLVAAQRALVIIFKALQTGDEGLWAGIHEFNAILNNNKLTGVEWRRAQVVRWVSVAQLELGGIAVTCGWCRAITPMKIDGKRTRVPSACPYVSLRQGTGLLSLATRASN